MQPTYELFDHTADMGIRVRAMRLSELLAPAGEALYAVIGELVAAGQSRSVTLNLVGEDPAELLREYLSELLTMFDRDARRFTSLDVHAFDEQHLSITVRTADLDRERSSFLREVKAITYHELAIRQVSGGYEATVIVDI